MNPLSTQTKTQLTANRARLVKLLRQAQAGASQFGNKSNALTRIRGLTTEIATIDRQLRLLNTRKDKP